jgi:hypothetical protein
MRKGLLAVVALVLVYVPVFAGTYLMNDTGQTVYGLRVTFSEPVKITAFGDVLTHVDPTGRATQFTFSGGEVSTSGGEWFNWESATAELMSHEWLTSPAAASFGASSTVQPFPEPDYQVAYDKVIGDAFARDPGGAPGDQPIPNLGITSSQLEMRYTTFLEILIRNTGNEPAAVRSPDAVIGPLDPLHHGWGSEIRVYLGTDSNSALSWVRSILGSIRGWTAQVLGEINTGLGRRYLPSVNDRSEASLVFDFSQVDYVVDRDVVTSVNLDDEGNPVSSVFKISGLFKYEDDFKTRLRGAIVEALLLYKDYDPDLLEHQGYDKDYFEQTAFSKDLLNMIDVLSALRNGRDFSLDKNEVNESPIVVLPETMIAHVGEKVMLDASKSFDPDGQIVKVTWEQVFGTKEGTEYMSANRIPIPDPHATTWTFTPQWSGNYRFRLTITDNEGRSNSRTIDAGVTWEKNPLEMRGADAFAYWDPSSLTTFAPQILKKMVLHGIQWLEFAPYGWMRTKTSTEIVLLGNMYPGCPGFTISDSDLTQLIELAHSLGLKVFLRPTLEFYNWADWRGVLAPSDVGAWFASYKQFITHYARVARDTGVEMFSVGNELLGVQGYTSQWEDVIHAVRSIVPKTTILTYCDQSLIWSYSNVRFWGALDLISVDFYYPITGSGNVWDTGVPKSDNPPYSTYLASITKSFEESLERAHDLYGRDVLIAETGCASVVGANTMPSTWQFDKTAKLDMQQQQDYLEAVLQVASTRSWIRGVFAYCVELKSDLNYQIEDWPFGHSIVGRPAYTMLSYWFSGR